MGSGVLQPLFFVVSSVKICVERVGHHFRIHTQHTVAGMEVVERQVVKLSRQESDDAETIGTSLDSCEMRIEVVVGAATVRLKNVHGRAFDLACTTHSPKLRLLG